MDTLVKIFWVGLEGVSRGECAVLAGSWVDRLTGAQFPWGTFIINVTGAFILGFFVTLMAAKIPPAHPTFNNLRLLVAVGFVGAYTTFSTFEYETLKLASSGSVVWAIANIALSVIAGFFAVWLGVQLAGGAQ